MTGFTHSPAGGNGALVVPSLHSPNYDPSTGTGWSINADGSATFYSVSLPDTDTGTPGTLVTFSGTAPSTPVTGDVWFDISAGLQPYVFDGTSWQPYQFGTDALASGSITSAQLATSVTARSLGGITTTVATAAPTSGNVAGDVWINSATGQLSQYTGSAWTPVTFNASSVIQDGTIEAGQIAAGTIGAAQIAAGAITAAQIASGTITGTQIEAGAELSAPVITGGTIVGAEIIADGTSGEFYAYSGTPGADNLVATVSGTSGTDSYGNAYTGTVAAYYRDSGTTYATWLQGQNGGGGMSIAAVGADSPYMAGGIYGTSNSTAAVTALASGAATSSDVQATLIVAAQSDGGIAGGSVLAQAGYVQLDGRVVATGGTASSPTLISTDTWHAARLASGWSNSASTTTLEYKLMPDNTVRIAGQVQNSAAISGNVTIFTLPSGYYSVSKNQYLTAMLNNGTTYLLVVTTAGVVELYGLPSIAAKTSFNINVSFPVDN